jgi:hypothetical protein
MRISQEMWRATPAASSVLPGTGHVVYTQRNAPLVTCAHGVNAVNETESSNRREATCCTLAAKCGGIFM